MRLRHREKTLVGSVIKFCVYVNNLLCFSSSLYFHYHHLAPTMVRVAVLDRDKCRPKRCTRECYRFCPKVRSKVEVILFEEEQPRVVEALCVGCGICIKKCPFKALNIVNLPDELEKETSHRLGPNAFKLFRLPTPS